MKTVSCYHAHVYFAPDQYDAAVRFRQMLGRNFKVDIGNVHHEPVGPHTMPMYQVVFIKTQFTAIVTWMMFNRHGLTILIHPESGDDLKDHTEYSLWLGQSKAIDTSVFTQ